MNKRRSTARTILPDALSEIMKDNTYASDDEIESSGYYIEDVEEEQEESGTEAFVNSLLDDVEFFADEEEDE